MKFNWKKICFTLAAGSLLLGSQPAMANYVEVDLGLVDVTRTYATDLNDNSTVVGYGRDNELNQWVRFLWDEVNGTTVIDSTVSLYIPAVNNNEQVVFNRTVYENGLELELPGFVSFRSRQGRSINNNGAVAGWADQSNSYTHAAKWQKDGTGEYVLTDLGALPVAADLSLVRSNAYAINDLGETVGESEIAAGSNREHAVFWDANNTIQDLGTLRVDDSTAESSARGINNLGQVIGLSDFDGANGKHEFLWDATNGMIDLQVALADHLSQVTGSTVNPLSLDHVYAVDINDLGQVLIQVGTYDTIYPETTGFVYVYQNGEFADITEKIFVSSLLQRVQVKGLNNNGQVIATGDWNGDWNDVRSYIIDAIDVPQPFRTTIILEGDQDPAGSYTSDVDVQLSKTNLITQEAETVEYSLDNINWQFYTGPFTVDSTGTIIYLRELQIQIPRD